ncbi:MAG: hypothetical protein WBI44_03490 [Syntrophaceticus sp.]
MQEKQQSKFSLNYYLGSLFLTLIGTLLFLVNARGLSEVDGLLLISILLMVAPLLVYIFYEKCSLSRRQALILLLVPLFALQYIFYLQAGVPVGFTDPHHHIFTCWNLFTDAGKSLFETVQTFSLNFVGLSILFRFLSLVSSLDIVTLAGIIPPFLNILVIIAVYLVVNRLHAHRTGLLAATLYGWENMVHLLGQELRTQTMGVFLLFLITALLLMLNRKTARSGVFAAVILVAGLVTTSFVCNFYALLVFTGAVCAVFIWFLLKRDLDWLVINSISIGLYIAFMVFCAVYLLYISEGFGPLLAQFSHILFNAVGQAMAPELGGIITKSILLIFLGVIAVIGFSLLYVIIERVTKWRGSVCFCLTAGLLCLLSLGFLHYTGQPFVEVAAKSQYYLGGMISLAQAQAHEYARIYSPFVEKATYLIWALLVVPYVCYFFVVIKNKDKNVKPLLFFAAYSVLLVFCLVNRLNSPLNPGRPYVAVLILLVAAMAYFLYNIPSSIRIRPVRAIMKITAVSLIFCFIFANVVKKPDYIIGNKTPFQSVPGDEDLVPYWHKDEGQYMASDFLAATASGRNVFACMTMQRYPFLISTYENDLTPLYGIGVQAENLKYHKGSLILLEDKIYGETFYKRDELPKTETLDQEVQIAKIYNNDDYLLYEVKE